MALFVMADLHLDVKSNKKSMEIFGNRWTDYVQKIRNNWKKLVTEFDTVVIPGDISWALNLEEAISDLKWIDELPGRKILLKGNHDFWWGTNLKMQKCFFDNQITTIDILSNNAIECENYIISGSRGWFTDNSMQTAYQNVDYSKIINRETIRLRMSLECAKKLHEETGKEILTFLHFPPVWGEFKCEEIISLLNEYNIKRCFFGHIHSCYTVPSSFIDGNIKFSIISADYLDFIPQFIG